MGNSGESESVQAAMDEYLLAISQAALNIDRSINAALSGTAFDTEHGKKLLEIARTVGRAEGAQRIFGKAVARLDEEGQADLMRELQQLGDELFGKH